MEPSRLAELADHVADGPPDGVRERAELALQIAWKAARKAMREEAAQVAVNRRQVTQTRKIVKAEILEIKP